MKKKSVLIATALLSALALSIPAFAAEWKQDPKGWWWERDDGSYPVSQWEQINGVYYYFGQDGYMYANTTTPDGYQVDASGAWVQNGTAAGSEAEAAQTKSGEIRFQDLAWGSSFTSVDEQHGDWKLMAMHGTWMVNPSVDAVLQDDYYTGIDFEYGDINLIASPISYKASVAGYIADEMKLYFAFVPVNGVLTKEETDSALYGAQYKFEPKNRAEMAADLKTKLTTLYGAAVKVTTDSDIWGNKSEFTWWAGTNGTELVLKNFDASGDTTNLYDDEIVISYAWRNGDTLMQTASDTMKHADTAKEQANYGNGQTSGL